MRQMEVIRAYANTAVGQLHYREAGEGTPLLLLHKTPSSSIQFVRAMPLLASRFRVIAMDTPGFGMSDPPSSPPRMHDYARAVVALLDALGIEVVDVVGHHTGASIALETAVRFSERVDRLVLAGILALETDEERERWRHYLDEHHFELDSTGEFLRVYPLPMLARDQVVSPEDPERYLFELVAYLQAGPHFWWAYDAVVEHRAFDLFPQLRRPVLVLNQAEGRVQEQTERAAAAIPGSRYVELPGGSEGAMDDPEVFAREILAFLA